MTAKRSLPATWLVGKKTRLRPLEAEDVPMLRRFGLTVDPAATGFIIQTLGGVDIGALGLLTLGPHASVAVAFEDEQHYASGAATDALRVICDGAFRSAPFVRVEALVDAADQAAVRAYRRAGFEREGLLRQALRVRAKFRDAVMLSVVRDG